METEHNYTRSIWLDNHSTVVKVIDLRLLPHKIVFLDLKNVDDIIWAIKEMWGGASYRCNCGIRYVLERPFYDFFVSGASCHPGVKDHR